MLCYVVCATTFFLVMFLYVSPRRIKRLIFSIATSTDPKDKELLSALSAAFTDHAMGFVAMLGDEFKKGNTAPLVRFVAPIMDAISFRIGSALDGATGHISRIQKGDAMGEYRQFRESIPASLRKYSDLAAGISIFLDKWQESKNDGSKVRYPGQRPVSGSQSVKFVGWS